MSDATDPGQQHPDHGAPTPPAQPPDIPAAAGEQPDQVIVLPDARPGTDADADGPSPLARRGGPIIAVIALMATIGMVVWMAAVPTKVEGQLSAAPFQVPGTLATNLSESGCLNLVDGRGGSTALCIEDAAEYGEVFFDEDGRLLVGGDREELLVVDQQSGEVLDTVAFEEYYRFEEPPGREGVWLNVDGAQVRDPDTDEVLLDVGGPPGYRLEQAVMSPDGEWVVAVDPGDRVIVAPVDGSAGPYVWAELQDGWLDLGRAILWTDGELDEPAAEG